MWFKTVETIVFGIAILYSIVEIRDTIIFTVNGMLNRYARLKINGAVIVSLLWTIFYALRSFNG